MKQDEDFNWLDDAFDEKKHAHDLEDASKGKGALLALLIALIAACVFFAGAAFILFAAIPS